MQPLQDAAVALKLAQARGDRSGIGCHQQAGFAIVDAFAEAADAGGQHRNLQAPQFGQCIAEGFRDAGRDQRQIRCQLRDQFR